MSADVGALGTVTMIGTATFGPRYLRGLLGRKPVNEGLDILISYAIFMIER